MRIPVYSPWLPGYINVVQTIFITVTMVGLFLERPCILIYWESGNSCPKDPSGPCPTYLFTWVVLLCPSNKMVIESRELFLSSVSHCSKWSNLKRGHENSQIRSQASPSEVQIVLGAIWGGGNPVKLSPLIYSPALTLAVRPELTPSRCQITVVGINYLPRSSSYGFIFCLEKEEYTQPRI